MTAENVNGVLSTTGKQTAADFVMSQSRTSVSAPANAPKTIYAAVHLFGYYIEPTGSDSCYVTIISQYGPTAQRLNVSWQRCQKIKNFVEELADWSALVEQ